MLCNFIDIHVLHEFIAFSLIHHHLIRHHFFEFLRGRELSLVTFFWDFLSYITAVMQCNVMVHKIMYYPAVSEPVEWYQCIVIQPV